MRKQITLGIAAILLLFTIICPPFSYMGRNLGHHWIASPVFDAGVIDSGKLMIEWLSIALFSAFIYLISGIGTKIFIFAIPALRIFRAMLWLSILWFGVTIVTTLFSGVNLSIDDELDSGKIVAIVFGKILTEIALIGIFFALRVAINRFHVKFYGCPHPSLIKPWSI